MALRLGAFDLLKHLILNGPESQLTIGESQDLASNDNVLVMYHFLVGRGVSWVKVLLEFLVGQRLVLASLVEVYEDRWEKTLVDSVVNVVDADDVFVALSLSG